MRQIIRTDLQRTRGCVGTEYKAVSSELFYYIIKIALCFENWELISFIFSARLCYTSTRARKDKQRTAGKPCALNALVYLQNLKSRNAAK